MQMISPSDNRRQLLTLVKGAIACAFLIILACVHGCDADGERDIRIRAGEGDPSAQLALGRIYLYGSAHNERDVGAAIRLLTASATRGSAEANFLLGDLFVSTVSDRYDLAKGLAHLEAAAQTGHARAQMALGIELQTSDPNKSIHWFSAAAKQGYRPALLGLASAYEQLGSREDLVRSYAWMALAADDTPGLREHGMVDLAAQLSAEEIKQGKALAAVFRNELPR